MIISHICQGTRAKQCASNLHSYIYDLTKSIAAVPHHVCTELEAILIIVLEDKMHVATSLSQGRSYELQGEGGSGVGEGEGG